MLNQNKLTTFFQNGFQIFDGSKYIKNFDDEFLNSLNWKNNAEEKKGLSNIIEYGNYSPEKTPELNMLMYLTHQEIALDIVQDSVEDYSIEKRTIWKGVNKYLCHWHTDAFENQILNPKEKYYNAFFLLYFNDMEKIKEGSISFKKIDTNEEWKIYPKPGTLIAVSCGRNFLHKPEMTDHLRVVCSFFFNLVDKNGC
jgi:hypothetical protein